VGLFPHISHGLSSIQFKIDCGKPRANGNKFKEERRLVDTCSEHYIVTEEEIREMIQMFAVNPDAFDLDEFFLVESDIVGATAETPIITV